MKCLPLLLLFLVGVGCAADPLSPASLEGHWHGGSQATDYKKGEEMADKAREAMAKVASSMHLDLKSDMTYTLKLAGQTINGKWTIAGKRIEATPDDANLKALTMKFDLDPDGKRMVLAETKETVARLTFSKDRTSH